MESPRERIFFEQAEAIQPGQHQVENDQVIAAVLGKMQAGQPIFRAVDGEAGTIAQSGSHIFRQPHLVFDHQYPHDRSITYARLSEAESVALDG